MIEDDGFYEWIDWETRNEPGAFPINNSGYLEIRNLDVVRHDILMFVNAFVIEYDDLNGAFNDSLCDRENDGISFLNLRVSINLLFAEHNVGILIDAGSEYGLMCYNKFCFTDSHSCGLKGKSGEQNGKSCVIKCDTTDQGPILVGGDPWAQTGGDLLKGFETGGQYFFVEISTH